MLVTKSIPWSTGGHSQYVPFQSGITVVPSKTIVLLSVLGQPISGDSTPHIADAAVTQITANGFYVHYGASYNIGDVYIRGQVVEFY